MESLFDTLRQLMAEPEKIPAPEWTDEMYRQYPYFTLPASIELQRLPDTPDNSARRMELMKRISLNSAGTSAVYRITDPSSSIYESFYPEDAGPETPTTDQAIDTFIDRYGDDDPRQQQLLERLIFNPTPDYAQILAEEEERSLPDVTPADDDSHSSSDDLINAFILKSRENYGHFPPAHEPEPSQPPVTLPSPEPISTPDDHDSSLLSESLAKIYIKQRRYAKAYEIIHSLSLKYPEKSVYFADQLRFLQKLIKNQKYLK